MKKILIILLSIIFLYNSYAFALNKPLEYHQLNQKISNAPKIMHFFSFFCPYCYLFEKKYHITDFMKNNLEKKNHFISYHLSFKNDPLSILLTKIWIIAQIIGVEDKIIIPFFKAIQETHTIHNEDHIKSLFIKETNINKKKYDQLWNSFSINMILQKNIQNVNKMKIDYIPTIIINGQYILDNYFLEKYFQENHSKKYIQMIQSLIKK
ncbi:DsbA family protein [Buchnera aphidicola]|uniref:DsbA family protein n=1 Tax=Buchnera aphidicola TaxID=9 RepID=UPI003BEF0BC7